MHPNKRVTVIVRLRPIRQVASLTGAPTLIPHRGKQAVVLTGSYVQTLGLLFWILLYTELTTGAWGYGVQVKFSLFTRPREDPAKLVPLSAGTPFPPSLSLVFHFCLAKDLQLGLSMEGFLPKLTILSHLYLLCLNLSASTLLPRNAVFCHYQSLF